MNKSNEPASDAYEPWQIAEQEWAAENADALLAELAKEVK